EFTDEWELLDFFHNPYIYEKRPIKSKFEEGLLIPIEKRIYLFEDFDTGNDVVLDRKLHVNTDSDSDSDSDTSKKPKSKKHKKKTKLDKINTDALITKKILTSKISLKDLLNALDGVFRLKKPVIFLTTNHIDKIDPALIRPGRVNYIVNLKEIELTQAIKMIN